MTTYLILKSAQHAKSTGCKATFGVMVSSAVKFSLNSDFRESQEHSNRTYTQQASGTECTSQQAHANSLKGNQRICQTGKRLTKSHCAHAKTVARMHHSRGVCRCLCAKTDAAHKAGPKRQRHACAWHCGCAAAPKRKCCFKPRSKQTVRPVASFRAGWGAACMAPEYHRTCHDRLPP